MKTNPQTKLTAVTKNDALFLYDLLKERESTVNISHKKMPTYAQHIKFNNKKIGAVYLSKQNEVGIFIKKNMHSQKLGTSVLNILMKKNHRKRYLANINPKNKKSIGFFKKNGFKLVQHTFELEQD